MSKKNKTREIDEILRNKKIQLANSKSNPNANVCDKFHHLIDIKIEIEGKSKKSSLSFSSMINILPGVEVLANKNLIRKFSSPQHAREKFT